jgi:hypothetical protein
MCPLTSALMSALGHQRTFAVQKAHVRFTPKSGHGVAPSEQMSFAVAAMASGRGPVREKIG